MKRISRRNFLKAMGISTTALALAACGGSSSSTAAGTPVLPLPAQQQPGNPRQAEPFACAIPAPLPPPVTPPVPPATRLFTT